ncbi:recombinase family protein [Desulfosporosinus sp. FKA]|uniref:recombinase family protein n=1 Tax=Desulfosporosinus sp. FKA TaxID=1969834 RepID=UPI000B4A42E0|nr:recombinase family protein [Desulfosporosinus sp. FKA]
MDTLKAAAYVRFSSDNQRDESIDAQIRAIKDYCKHNGYDVIKIYADRAKSATTDKRPQFQQMIQDSSLGVFDVVIVHKLDRFSRDKYDSTTYKRKLKKNGIRLVSVTENLDGSPESVILESLLEGMAEYYSKNLAREVMKGLKETAYQCKHTGGTPPLGYDIDPTTKKYVINEAEAKAVREIYSLYLNGYGYRRMITVLNEKGYKTKKGKPFGKNSIHELLRNEKYAGTYVFNRSASKDAFNNRNNHQNKDNDSIIRIEGGVPAIISKEDFQTVQTKMANNKKRPGFYRAKEIYLLSGLIFCGECGHAMQGNHRRESKTRPKYISYRCGNRDRTKQCDNKEIRREYIEMYVLDQLEKRLFNEKAIPHLVQMLNDYQSKYSSKINKEASDMETRLAEVKKQISNIVTAIEKGFYQESFKTRMSELEDEKQSIEIFIQQLNAKNSTTQITEDNLRQILSVFKQFVTEKNIPECKKFIDNYVNKVLVYKDHIEVVFSLCLGKDIAAYTFDSNISKLQLFQKYHVA